MMWFWVTLLLSYAYMDNVNSDCIVPPVGAKEYKLVTSMGTVRGAILEATPSSAKEAGKKFFGFRNIPYVEPMVGDRRWTYPVPMNKWPSEVDGTKPGPFCPQLNYGIQQIEGKEDCLKLNVYTHVLPSKDECKLRPVIFSIVNAAFALYFENGPAFIMREDVVHVTFYFRTGALGFLSTGDKMVPGNYGMFDQIEALKWVRDHIAEFGGDPNRVTIAGTKAGGVSGQLLMLSRLAKGLFHSLISTSGSPLCSWALETNPKPYYDIFVKELKCDKASIKDTLECLRGTTVQELLKVQLKIQVCKSNKYPVFSYLSKSWLEVQRSRSLLDLNNFPGNVHFLPVMDRYNGDEALLTDMPRALLEKGDYNHVPTIMGVAKDEGLFYAMVFGLEASTDGSIKSYNDLSKYLDPVINNITRYYTKDHTKAHIRNSINKKYFDGVTVSNNEAIYPAMANMLGDGGILSCTNEAIRLLSLTSKKPVYAYQFAYKGDLSFTFGLVERTKKQKIESSIFKTGVSNFDNWLYLFNTEQQDYLVESRDLEFSRHYVHIYAEFANMNDPSRYIPTWKPCGKGEVNYYQLKSVEPGSMIGEYRKEEINFWKEIIG